MSQKILIADKSITIQKIVELTFQEEEFEVISVSNGKEALEKLEQIQPSIILADISLPEIDGYELCRTIRQDPRYEKYAKIPLLLLAGIYETMDERKAKYVEEKSKEVNSNGVLTKPFDPQDLIQKVKQMALPAEKPQEARMKDIEEIFQVEETEEPIVTVSKGDETIMLSEEERRYIMGMPAEKELSPELTGDIFEESKTEEPFDFATAEKKESEIPPVTEKESIFEEVPPEPVKISEPAKSVEPVLEEVERKAEDETIFQAEEPKVVAPPDAEDIFHEEKVFDESPIPLAEEKVPVSAVLEDDILGIAEISKEEIKEEPPAVVVPVEVVQPQAEVLEVQEKIKQEEPAIAALFAEPAPIKEQDFLAEEAIDLKKEFETSPEMFQAEEVPSAEQVFQVIADAEEKAAAEKKEEVVIQHEIVTEQPQPIEIEEKTKVAVLLTEEHLLNDELIEKIAARVAEKLSQKILEEIAWQVVPDLAEKMIKNAVEKLQKKD